jgi:hypothetical protein
MQFAIGFGLVAMLVGAILVFAVETSASGIDLQVVGWILMVVGAAGAALATLALTTTDVGRRDDRVIER